MFKQNINYDWFISEVENSKIPQEMRFNQIYDTKFEYSDDRTKITSKYTQFDNAHYILISYFNDPGKKPKEQDKNFIETRTRLIQSFGMGKYYEKMDTWNKQKNVFG